MDGGTLPLGYDLKDKQLIPNLQETELVNLIFSKYLELGNIQATADWMNQQGYHSKCWQTASGDKRGGHLFRHGSIQRILGNPVSIGKIAHLALKKVYPGKHKGIIPQEVFESVQAKLGANKDGLREYRRHIRTDTLLGEVLVDERERPYKLSSGRQGGKVFKYYVIRNGAHLSVGQLDGLVLQTIQNADYGDICPRTTALELSKNEAKTYLKWVICQKIGKECCVTIYLKNRRLKRLWRSTLRRIHLAVGFGRR